MKLISILIPVLNEEENIPIIYEKLLRIFEKLKNKYEFEIIFTDNHSTDRTFELLEDLANKDKRVKVIRFSKNFGFQRSIYTGYINSSGDAAIQIDCDMQDPPEMIMDFLSYWEKGYQVVYGIRVNRKEKFFLQLSRKIFYRLINLLSEDELPLDAGDFRLVDRVIIDEIKKSNDVQPYLRGLISTFGFNQIGIPYKRDERKAGVSKFNLTKLVSLALDGILNHSIVPLRISTYIGLIVSMITFLGLLYYSIAKIFFNRDLPPGFATTTVLILMSISLNALFLGIIGEYLGRIYKQVKKSSITIIEKKINI